MKSISCVAKTQEGLEDVLLAEIENLGGINAVKGKRHVSFETDQEGLYRMNYNLRTAMNILVPIAKARVKNTDQLYAFAIRVKWDKYMSVDKTFAITSSVKSDYFTHSQYAALKVKDAIADYFRKFYGSRPNVERDLPDIKIDVHIDRENVTLSLDSSGSSLFKRGYRKNAGHAPINEVLAAGLVMLSGWDGQSDFMDPMCGSGTILAEAAMIACNIPPNLMRKEFAFERWEDWDVELFEKIEESLLNKTRDFHHKMYGYDKSPSAVAKAKDNIKNAHLDEFITIQHEDFFKTQKAGEQKLHMVFNPPYGERLDIDMEAFYKSIGDTLKQGYPGTDAWFITSNLEALKHVGLRPSRKIHLVNAKLEARLVKYVMYEGSKKGKYMNNDKN